jgi:hypothetical protein
MAVRPDEGAAGTIERWRSGLSGPQLTADPEPLAPAGADEQPAMRQDGASQRDQYDEDFDYYWGDWKIPLWIALIWQVPWRQRLDIFVIGFIVGLVIAGVAVSWGLLLSRY